MPKSIRILHLSDFHFCEAKQWDALPLQKGLGKCIGALRDAGLSPDLVAFTGDIAWSGKAEDYKLARAWIDDHLLPALGGISPQNLLFIPGNHDIDRAEVTEVARAIEKMLRERSQQDITAILTGKDAPIVLRRHHEYLEFVNAYRPPQVPRTNLWWAERREFDGFTLGIAGFASSLLSYGDDANDKGRLLLSVYQANAVFQELDDADACLVLMHHPLSYLVDEENTQQRFEKQCSILLRGHLHHPKLIGHVVPGSEFLELAAGSVYAGSDYPNSFQLIELRPDEASVHVHYRRWQDLEWKTDRNAPGVETGDFAAFRLRLLRKPRAGGAPARSGTAGATATEPGKPAHRPDAAALGTTLTAIWTREVPRLPLPRTALRELSLLVGEIRALAYGILRKHERRLQDRQVRANVFLPDYRRVAVNESYELFMPEELRKNMNHPPEWEIRFQPGQGATGVAFEQGQQRFSRRLPRRAGEWETVLHLTDELKQKVHKDLEWIVTLPLQDPVTDLTLGVLNIDGLDFQFDNDLLSRVVASLTVNIQALAILLAEQPRVRVSLDLCEVI